MTYFIAGTAAFNGATWAQGTVLASATGVLDYLKGNQLAPRTLQDITP